MRPITGRVTALSVLVFLGGCQHAGGPSQHAEPLSATPSPTTVAKEVRLPTAKITVAKTRLRRGRVCARADHRMRAQALSRLRHGLALATSHRRVAGR